MDSKKVNWGLTLLFCLLFGALGYIAGTMSNCGKSSSCEATKQSCSSHHGQAENKGCTAHHGQVQKRSCSAHHGEERSEKKCCSADKKCDKHSEHKKEVIVEVEETISEH